MAKLRLNKILAQAGLGSRRRADGLIAEGHVAVNGVVTPNLATLADPDADRITVDGRPATPVAVELVRARADASRLRLTFTEGRKHEVKRYCQALGHPVVRLRRVAFGPVALGALAPGALRRLTPRELAALRAAVADRAGGRRER